MTPIEQLNSHPHIINKLIANETGSTFSTIVLRKLSKLIYYLINGVAKSWHRAAAESFSFHVQLLD